VVAGLLLSPLILAALWYGVGQLRHEAATAFQISWVAAGALLAAAIGLAFLAGSRLSPVAALLGGLSFTALGVLPFVEMVLAVRVLPGGLLPATLENGYLTVGLTGLQLFLGVMLLVVSAFPTRWRSRAEPPLSSPAYSPAPAPYSSYNGPEDATRPMFRE
jgi:hypothetical protein